MTDAVKLHIREQQCIELSGVLNYSRNPKRNDQSAETGIILPIPNKTIKK